MSIENRFSSAAMTSYSPRNFTFSSAHFSLSSARIAAAPLSMTFAVRVSKPFSVLTGYSTFRIRMVLVMFFIAFSLSAPIRAARPSFNIEHFHHQAAALISLRRPKWGVSDFRLVSPENVNIKRVRAVGFMNSHIIRESKRGTIPLKNLIFK